MSTMKALLVISSLVLTVILVGCGGTDLADLVPPNPNPDIASRVGFCLLNEEGKLVVTVKNQGTIDINTKFTTTVEFLPGGSPPPAIILALQAGGTEKPTFDIPATCWNPDCDFKITVDSGNNINESNEENNSANGRCIG